VIYSHVIKSSLPPVNPLFFSVGPDHKLTLPRPTSQ